MLLRYKVIEDVTRCKYVFLIYLFTNVGALTVLLICHSAFHFIMVRT